MGSALSLRVFWWERMRRGAALLLAVVLGNLTGEAREFAILAAGAQRLPECELRTAEGTVLRSSQLLTGQPVVLVPFYSRCPHTCSLLMIGWSELARRLRGENAKWVSISFDPRESDADLQQYARRWGLTTWLLLRGDSGVVAAMLEALGISVRWDSVAGVYEHPNVAAVLTPTGRLSRLIFGIRPEEGQVRLALWEAQREAADVGIVRGFLLRCFRFDAQQQRYVLDWSFLVQVWGGLAFVCSLLLWMLWEVRRKPAPAPLGTGVDTGGRSAG
ncbi:hypothetical protein HRbin21_01509 [bacterium HR21]|jgi:protein SCO1/2|nr:hypothetical protein HRbin21_01509 [bacterium HR21]